MIPLIFHHLPLPLLVLLLLVPPPPVPVAVVVSEVPSHETEALLSFYRRILHARRLVWNDSIPTCQWRGITCDTAQTTVVDLRLPGMGLIGPIPHGTISLLSNIRVISLRYNLLSGSIPQDLGNLPSLRELHLQHNRLSGSIPPAISTLTRLERLVLSHNDLTGKIPATLNSLTALTVLVLNHNSFIGGIPAIAIASLTEFNVSFNRLNGSIPASLSRFPLSSFKENPDLCGQPLPPCPSSPAPPPPPPPSARHGLSTPAIIGVAFVGGGILLFLILILLILAAQRRRGRRENATKTSTLATESSMSPNVGAKRRLGDVEERSKLVLFENGPYNFDLEDLLRASAEVLGKGSFGTSYKALLEDGNAVVVKRIKDIVVTMKEFDQQMEVLGRVRHDNVVPLRAYYYSMDEKLLVYDYLDAGSLSATLHGSRASSRAALDWSRRLRVALALARGIFHLHSANLVHGNVKASNVLLGKKPEAAALSDAGLWVLFRKGAGGGKGVRARKGYRAPEEVATGRVSVDSDVYSVGVVILELLTGRAANDLVVVDEETIDLPRWVRSVVSEEWTGEVFDPELVKYGGAKAEEEMLQVLQVAMACVEVMPERRARIEDVVRLLEEVVAKADSSDEPSKDASDTPSPLGAAG